MNRVVRGMPAILLGSALVGVLAVAAITGRPSATVLAQEAVAPKPSRSAARAELAEISKLLTTGPSGLAPAIERLKVLDGQPLETGEREDWLRLARTAALRTGDRTWLDSMRDVPDRFALVMIQRILLASSSLAAADFEAVRAHLAAAGDPDQMNEREKRRCQSILARLARLEGDSAQERIYIDQLVDHLPHWPKPMCQSCHATLAEPDKLTHLNISDLWFGDRFVALLREQGDAERVRAESESRLARRSEDARARIRLGYALRALGQEEAAIAAFKALPWADFPDREVHKPRMMSTFP